MTLEQTISPAIEKFNSVMEEYTQSASGVDHTDFKAQEKFEKEWEEKINDAEKLMEKEMEEEIQKEQEALNKEQEESEKLLKELEEKDAKEREDAMENEKEVEGEQVEKYSDIRESIMSWLDTKAIAKKYKAKYIKGFASSLGLPNKWKESDIAEIIIKELL